MWSFAIILWELYTREVPFGKYSAVQCGLLVREHFLITFIKPKAFI